MEIPLLKDVVIIFVLAMVVVYLSHRLKLPAIVGLLATGVLAGPHALGLVSALDEVDKLAKIGVILLLFTIGIEFSLRRLMKIKTLVLIGGSLQVGATVFVVYALTYYGLNWSFGAAMFMGFLIFAPSSFRIFAQLNFFTLKTRESFPEQILTLFSVFNETLNISNLLLLNYS